MHASRLTQGNLAQKSSAAKLTLVSLHSYGRSEFTVQRVQRVRAFENARHRSEPERQRSRSQGMGGASPSAPAIEGRNVALATQNSADSEWQSSCGKIDLAWGDGSDLNFSAPTPPELR